MENHEIKKINKFNSICGRFVTSVSGSAMTKKIIQETSKVLSVWKFQLKTLRCFQNENSF